MTWYAIKITDKRYLVSAEFRQEGVDFTAGLSPLLFRSEEEAYGLILACKSYTPLGRPPMTVEKIGVIDDKA